MSFGFGVGDFLAVIKLATKIRRTFTYAPEQFKALSHDLRSLFIVIQDIEVERDRLVKTDSEKLDGIILGCEAILRDVENTVSKYKEIDTSSKRLGLKRTWKKLKWEPDDVRDLRSRITSQISVLNGFIQQRTERAVAKIVDHQEDQRRMALLESVSPADYIAQQSDLANRSEPGSRKWLLESPEYAQWLAQNGTVLYCPGMPGAGKTISMAVVVEDLRAKLDSDPGTLTCFVYCTYQVQIKT